MKSFFIILLYSVIFISCAQEETTETSAFLKLSLQTGFDTDSVTTVNVDATLEINVSIALDSNSVTESSVYVQNSAGIIYPSHVSLDGYTIVVKPKGYLDANSSYSLVVTTALSAVSGERLSSDASVSFETGAGIIDTTQPGYLTSLPLEGASFDIDGQMYYQFTEPISGVGIKESDFILTDVNASKVIPLFVDVEENHIIMIPQTQLTSGNSYTLSNTSTTLTDANGNSAVGTIVDINFIASSALKTDLNLTAIYDAQSVVNTIISFDYELPIFVAANNGLHIFTAISSPEGMSFESKISSDIVGKVYNVEVNILQNLIYIATSKGFFIVDITSPSSPSIIGTYLTSAPVYGLYNIDVNTTVIAVSSEGIAELNTTNPGSITLVGTYSNTGTAFEILHDGTDFITAEYTLGMSTYPAGIFQPGLFTIPTVDVAGTVKDIILDGADVIAATGVGGLQRWDKNATTLTTESRYDSYVDKIISSNGSWYTNVRGVGLAWAGLTALGLNEYFTAPFDIKTFSIFQGDFGGIMILADKFGKIYTALSPLGQ